MKINLVAIIKLFNNIFFNNYFLVFVLTLLFLGLIILLIKLVNKVLNNIIIFNQDIKKEIQNSVQTKFIKFSPEADVLIQFAIDYWRLNKKINGIIKKLTEKEKLSLSFTLDRIKKYLDRSDIEIKDYTNEKYYEGLNVNVISVEKHKQSSKDSSIKDTIEPAVMIKGLLVKKAKVIILTN